MTAKGKSNKNVQKSCGPPKLNESCPNDKNTVTLTPEFEQQFQMELCWCIQQLQTALQSGKLNNKQVQDHTKALNTLMNNAAPMVKKRQVMRLSFGDYRAKMAAEEKKSSRNALNMQVKPAVPNKRSIFVKKSGCASSTRNKFQFNFHLPEQDLLSKDVQNIAIEPAEGCDKNRKDSTFMPSDNSFRFSFEIKESHNSS